MGAMHAYFMIRNFSKVAQSLQRTPKTRYNSCWKARWRFKNFVTCSKSRGGNCLGLATPMVPCNRRWRRSTWTMQVPT